MLKTPGGKNMHLELTLERNCHTRKNKIKNVWSQNTVINKSVKSVTVRMQQKYSKKVFSALNKLNKELFETTWS